MRHHAPAAEADELRDHVVIGGYGRVGPDDRAPARRRERALRRARHQWRAGDGVPAARAPRAISAMPAGREFLARVGAARARAFVVTVNARSAAERMVAAARTAAAGRPGLRARAIDAAHAARLLSSGPSTSSRKRSRRACSSAAGCSKASGFPTTPWRDGSTSCAIRRSRASRRRARRARERQRPFASLLAGRRSPWRRARCGTRRPCRRRRRRRRPGC